MLSVGQMAHPHPERLAPVTSQTYRLAGRQVIGNAPSDTSAPLRAMPRPQRPLRDRMASARRARPLHCHVGMVWIWGRSATYSGQGAQNRNHRHLVLPSVPRYSMLIRMDPSRS